MVQTRRRLATCFASARALAKRLKHLSLHESGASHDSGKGQRRIGIMLLSLQCALLLTVSGCGLRRLAFDNADWLAMYRLDSYFDLTSAQKKRFKPVVQRYIEQARQVHVPRAIALLEEGKAAVADGLTAEEVDKLWLSYSQLRIAALSDLMPDAAVFLKTLAEDQWQHLAEELADSNERWQELAETKDQSRLERRQRKRYEDQIDRFEDFVGDLDERQKAMLRPLVFQQQSTYADYYRARVNAQQTFVTKAKAATEVELKTLLNTWVEQPATWYGEDHYARISTRRLAWQAFMVDFSQTLTPAQHKKLQESLTDWRDFLEKQSR